jgi:hypothetical protein
MQKEKQVSALLKQHQQTIFKIFIFNSCCEFNEKGGGRRR